MAPRRRTTALAASTVAVLAFALVPSIALARVVPAKSEEVPVERLVKNLTRQLEASPDSADVHFALGRIHAIAYASGAHNVKVGVPAGGVADTSSAERGAWSAKQLPEFDATQSVRVRRGGAPVDAARTKHLQRAILHYTRAVEIAPDVPVRLLGLAWLLESGADLAPSAGWPDGVVRRLEVAAPLAAELQAAARALESADAEVRADAIPKLRAAGPAALPLLVPVRSSAKPEAAAAAGALLTQAWYDLALPPYRKALALTAEADRLRAPEAGIPDGIVSGEAAAGIARILATRPETPESKQERDTCLGIEAEVRKKRPKPVSPVVFAVRRGAGLRDLAPAGRSAVFDLDADGEPEPRGWVTPDTAVLVWQPTASAPVTSGARLFGNRTWGAFWPDGYAALAALDDDGNGRLSGPELTGIAVWRDLDGDAIAAPGEVVPAAEYGVESIATRPDGVDAGVLAHGAGVTLRDGTTRPSWDWVSSPARDPDEREPR